MSSIRFRCSLGVVCHASYECGYAGALILPQTVSRDPGTRVPAHGLAPFPRCRCGTPEHVGQSRCALIPHRKDEVHPVPFLRTRTGDAHPIGESRDSGCWFYAVRTLFHVTGTSMRCRASSADSQNSRACTPMNYASPFKVATP
jgi:hypothetical protein